MYHHSIVNTITTHVSTASDRSDGNGGCAGLGELRAEVEALRGVVLELQAMVGGQQDIAQQTHAALATLTEQLTVPRTSPQQQEAEGEQEEVEEDEEQTPSTTQAAPAA